MLWMTAKMIYEGLYYARHLCVRLLDGICKVDDDSFISAKGDLCCIYTVSPLSCATYRFRIQYSRTRIACAHGSATAQL